MADIKYYDIILQPVVTEIQIKQAVEKMFEWVKVDSVNTMNLTGKTKRRGYTFGKTNNRKKAIVTLKEDSKDIEIFQGM